MSTAVKRACDACHRRKVKCDGINPCRNCASAQLGCTYNAVPQKKGPKGSRAKVISELRETQRQTSLSAKIQNRINGIVHPPCSPSLSPTPGLLTSEMAKESIEFYFANMYSIFPILNRAQLEHKVHFLDQNLDTYCLVTALCAFMALQPGMVMPGLDPAIEQYPGTNIISATLLMEEAIRVRKGLELMDAPTLDTLCTSYLLFAYHYTLEFHDKAWFYLREATTLAHILGMANEQTYSPGDVIESSRRRRLFWLLFVAERAYALDRGRPTTLGRSIRPPTMTDDPTDPQSHQLNSFIHIVDLFQSFDDVFVGVWNKARGECSSSYLAELQKQVSNSRPSYLSNQDQDLQTNQQWLKTVSWRLKAQSGCTPQTNEDQMALHYPIDTSQTLVSITSQLATQGAEILGVPLVAKVLEISCALVEVLAMQPSSGSAFGNGPREQLAPLLGILAALRNGEHNLIPLLIHKIHEVVPRLASPELQRAPDNASCTMDLFDGFGTAGMAQGPLITDFKTEPFTPSGVQHLEDMVPESATSATAQPSASLSSPFPMVASPPLVSPADYQQMGDYNSIPDMMGSMGQSSQSSLGPQGSLNHAQQQHQQQAQPQHQRQPQHQHHGLPTHSMAQNPNIRSHMQQAVPGNLGHGLSHEHAMAGLNQQTELGPNQSFSHHDQGLMNGVMHRPPPQRADSFALHQPPQIRRTMGEFNVLQQGNAENMSIGAMGLGNMGTEMDFSSLRS